MRIGILGGTFDPIHFGHLLLAETCREAAHLDQVWFVPASMSPHKRHLQSASAADRCEMIQLAIAGHPDFVLCPIEIERGGVSYTVETLASLQARFPEHAWYFIVGADSLVDFPTWREPAQICAIATLLVAHRPLERSPDVALLAPFLPRKLSAERTPQIVAMPQVEFSSRDLRARLAAYRSIRYRTPDTVIQYIRSRGLYGNATEPDQGDARND